ncbi:MULTISPECIES: DUF2459 domain-containing protein [unclassified Microcoleus]|uniref:DUF2459 domain-containing protein n=1 Tax=unclassified Microcoleus TaxID=2642155 RepID=UPI002FD4CA5D
MSFHQNYNAGDSLYISNQGIHTEIIVPVKNEYFDGNQYLLLTEIGRDATSDYKYLSFGWGDRAFIEEGRSPMEVGRRKKEEPVIAMVSAIKNVLTVLAVAICWKLPHQQSSTQLQLSRRCFSLLRLP